MDGRPLSEPSVVKLYEAGGYSVPDDAVSAS